MTQEFVVGIGEVLWDMLPEGKKMGGAPANFAYHVSQFGLEARIVSTIGNDRLGDEVIEHLNQKKVPYLIERVPYPTGTVEVEVDGDGIPCYSIRKGVAWDNIPYTPALDAIACATRCVCFGSLAQRAPVSRTTINRFLSVMPKGDGYYRVFDINLRQDFYTPDILLHSMNECNILKLNDEELVTISRIFGYPGIDLRAKCHALVKEHDLRVLILTCGVNGSYVFTPDDVSFLETPRVDVVDTVGAGDSFTAAFIAALIKGKSIEEAHRLAVRVSAYVCTHHGAMTPFPPEIIAALA